MEHLVSTQTGKRLLALIRYLLKDKRRIEKVREALDLFDKECGDHSSEDCPVCVELGFCLCELDDAGSRTR